MCHPLPLGWLCYHMKKNILKEGRGGRAERFRVVTVTTQSIGDKDQGGGIEWVDSFRLKRRKKPSIGIQNDFEVSNPCPFLFFLGN